MKKQINIGYQGGYVLDLEYQSSLGNNGPSFLVKVLDPNNAKTVIKRNWPFFWQKNTIKEPALVTQFYFSNYKIVNGTLVYHRQMLVDIAIKKIQEEEAFEKF